MKMRLKKAVGILLSACLLLSVFPMDCWPSCSVVAAENGTLQNGTLNENMDGWEVEGDCSTVGIDQGHLNVYEGEKESSTFKMSQTVANMKAGAYVAGIAIVGEGNPLELSIKNETSGKVEKVTLATQGWTEGWETSEDRMFATKSLEVAEGDNITITLGGTVNKNNWYNAANITLTPANEEQGAVPASITVKKVDGLSEDFVHGVDVSMYLSEVQSGVKYYDKDGNEQNLFDILSDAGVNYVRLRLWECPYAVDYNGCWRYVNDAEPGKETEYYTADRGKNENGINIVSPDVTAYTTGEGQTYKYKDNLSES